MDMALTCPAQVQKQTNRSWRTHSLSSNLYKSSNLTPKSSAPLEIWWLAPKTSSKNPGVTIQSHVRNLKAQARWAGNILCMEDKRIPKFLLYKELMEVTKLDDPIDLCFKDN